MREKQFETQLERELERELKRELDREHYREHYRENYRENYRELDRELKRELKRKENLRGKGACLNIFVFTYNNIALFTIIYNIYKRLALWMFVCIPGRSGNLFWFSDIFYLPYLAIPDLQGFSATNAKHLSALNCKGFNI